MKEFIEKLIGRLEEYPHGKYEDEYGKGFSAGINASIEEVNELAEEYINTSSDASSGWIPCSERLPEEGVDVLVWFEYYRYGSYNRLYQTTGISFTYNGEWSGFVNGSSGWSQLSIIAWQPLPAPYKEGGE